MVNRQPGYCRWICSEYSRERVRERRKASATEEADDSQPEMVASATEEMASATEEADDSQPEMVASATEDATSLQDNLVEEISKRENSKQFSKKV